MNNKFKLMVVVLFICILITGCGTKMKRESDLKNQSTNESMFVLLENGGVYKIVYHQETKVMYAISAGPYNCGAFTVMLDAEGKPLLYKEEK